MQRILLGLLVSYLIVVGATVGAGFWVHDADSFAVHFAIGLFATILTCLIFCVVLTYFVIKMTGSLEPSGVEAIDASIKTPSCG